MRQWNIFTASQIVPQHLDLSMCRVDKAAEQAQQGRFSGAVMSDDSNAFALGYIQMVYLQ